MNHLHPRFRHYFMSLIVAGFIMALFTRGQALATHSTPPGDAELAAMVDSIMGKALSRPNAVGFSVAIARGQEVIVEKGYGVADLEHDVPVTSDTVFRIGSVTKQFTAAAIMKLAEDGKLSIDDNITMYVPDFPTQGHVVTIRHLLNHTSGIVSYTSLGEEWAKVRPLEMSHEQMLDLFKDKPFDFEPGQKWNYSNSGYYLLGMIIEKVGGAPYGDWLKSHFFEPLKLTHTRYDVNADIIPHRAQGYRVANGVVTNDGPLGMSQPGAAGGLLSSAGDLVRWQMALAGGDGRIISSESFTLMATPTILPDGEDTNYGFGLSISKRDGRKCIAHSGGINGFQSHLAYFPDDQLHIAILSNSQSAALEPVVRSLQRAALGIPEPEIKDLPVPDPQAKAMVGQYVIQRGKLPIRFTSAAGKMVAQARGQGPVQLHYQGEGEFRADFDHDVRFVFDLPADGSSAPSFTLFQGGAELKALREEPAASAPDSASNDSPQR